MLLHPSVIERFARCVPGCPGRRGGRCARTCGSSAAGPCRICTRRTCRFRGSASKQPYSAAEIAGFLALADAQPAAARRMRAAALVCLGAGAGLIRGDLRGVRGTDVACRSGGVVVDVRGPRARAVPVLPLYQGRLLAAAGFAGDSLICGGTDDGRRNITHPLVRAWTAGAGCRGWTPPAARHVAGRLAGAARAGHVHARGRDQLLPAAGGPDRRARTGQRGGRGGRAARRARP